MQLFKVKKELELSLDTLCDKNLNKFEMKLSFHAQQMELAIANSAQLVIQSLSGPSDRLVNEVSSLVSPFLTSADILLLQDLKQLWKEMVTLFVIHIWCRLIFL